MRLAGTLTLSTWLSAALLAAPAPGGAKVQAGDAAPAVASVDAMGRAVAVPATGRVTVLSFATKSTGERAGAITRAVRVEHPEAEVVSVVDLSGFPAFLHGTIRGKVRAKHPGAVRDAEEAFTKAGKTPPADLDARMHIVPDFDASFCKAYGATDMGKEPKVVVVGADGNVKAVFDAPTAEAVSAAVATELARP